MTEVMVVEEFKPQMGERFCIAYQGCVCEVEVMKEFRPNYRPYYRTKITQSTGNRKEMIGKKIYLSASVLTRERKIQNR